MHLGLCLEQQIVIDIFWVTIASVSVIKPFIWLMRSRRMNLRWWSSYRVRYIPLIWMIYILTRDAENLMFEMFFLGFFLFRFRSGSIIAIEITDVIRIIATRQVVIEETILKRRITMTSVRFVVVVV